MRFSTVCFIVASLGVVAALGSWVKEGFYDSIDTWISAMWAFMYASLYKETKENEDRK